MILRPLPTLALIGALLLPGGATLAARKPKPKPPPVYVPHTGLEGAPELQGTTFLKERTDASIWLKRIDGDDRLRYIKSTTGFAVDPFATPEGQAARFLSFLVVVKNGGDADSVEFNPLTSWLVTNAKDAQSPIGLTELGFAYRALGLELPPAYEKIGPALLYMPHSIAPGESVSGLLIFRALKPRTKFFKIDTKISLPNGELVRFSAPYRRLTKKELREKP